MHVEMQVFLISTYHPWIINKLDNLFFRKLVRNWRDVKLADLDSLYSAALHPSIDLAHGSLGKAILQAPETSSAKHVCGAQLFEVYYSASLPALVGKGW